LIVDLNDLVADTYPSGLIGQRAESDVSDQMGTREMLAQDHTEVSFIRFSLGGHHIQIGGLKEQ
jgi:hypothetical protein